MHVKVEKICARKIAPNFFKKTTGEMLWVYRWLAHTKAKLIRS